MTLPIAQSVSSAKADPILLELWEIKRQLNEEAHYDIAEIARRASAFDLAATMKKLGVPFDHVIKVTSPQAGVDQAIGLSATHKNQF